MTADRYVPPGTDVDELTSRVRALEHELAELARHGASDRRVEAVEDLVEQAFARIRQLERRAETKARA
ncbi:MAG TPA: hypothetical protein VKB59_19465 [Micromonosporaceae bacterium]|nr:hypothetical protein [Micromonosporaceae bacterium]